MLREKLEDALPHGAARAPTALLGLWRTCDLCSVTVTSLYVICNYTGTNLYVIWNIAGTYLCIGSTTGAVENLLR
jgi:hypothetical protein